MELGFDVVEFEASDHVAAGETAPDFTRPLATDEFWEDRSLSELAADDPVVLVFHPMDGDFPATYIWQEIRDREWVDDWDAHVVGLSISTPYEHEEFLREWRDFEAFRLFSDPSNEVAEQYGIVHDLDGMTGIAEPKPAVYVVDTDMTVRWAWVAEEWPDFPPYDAVEEAVDDL
ncbi:redoxin domain-containing protein [Halorarius halobius]|uniref:redoxin domain-containing protein n=1 Tax=Halorarius halobius TaxID=2962671 RepID=UPI0020CFB4CA|nr:redoxin domain-containing protein [Halorarius halobius]